MAQYRHTIEVTARFVDKLTKGARGASDSLGDIGDSAEKSQKKVDKLDRMMAKLDKFHQMTVGIKDTGAYKTLKKITDTAEGLTKKAWTALVKVKDLALSPIRAIKNALFSIPTLITAVIGAKIVQQGVMQPVSIADSIEQSRIAFETKLGSKTAADKFLQDIYKFDEKSPFDTIKIVGLTQQMMNLGWTAENVLNDLGTIGDWAASLGKGEEGISAVTRALGQMRMKGKLSSEEMLQLTEAGVDAWNYVARYMGKDITEIRAMAEDGLISVEDAITGIMAGMSEYTGAAATMADRTVSGLIDQIKSLFNTYITLPWGEGIGEGLKDALAKIRDFVDENKDTLKRLGLAAKEVGQSISKWISEKAENALKRLRDLTETFEWDNASAGGKLSLLWKGLVSDPLKEWWESGGRTKAIETAGKIGKWIGEALTSGILAILGITDLLKDDSETKSAAATVAQGFAQGFVDGFDVSAITDKLVEAISNVWNALPAWAKALVVGYGTAKVGTWIGNLGSGIGNIMSTIGKTGLWGVGGSGILGGLSKLGYGASSKMGTKAAASLLGIGGGTAALAGAGAIATGAGVIKSGVDFYQAYNAHRAGNTVERNANLASGGTTLGATALGAAIGTAILPGIGTLIGGGIGAVAGWIGGEAWAKKIRKENAETLYESQEMIEAIADAETSAEELAELFQKECWENFNSHMGDISLSLSEIEALANSIVWGDMASSFETFSYAADEAATNLQAFKTAAEKTNVWMWKSKVGMAFDEEDKKALKSNYDDYITAAKSYAESKHYEFTAAVGVLIDPASESGKSILEGGNAYYTTMQGQLDSITAQLSDKIVIALNDGVINLDEQAEIVNLQQQIADITSKVADAEAAAEIELARVKLGTGNLDAESWQTFMDTMQTTIDNRMAAGDEAFTAVVSALNIQLAEGAITQDEYDTQLEALTEGYKATLDSIKAEVRDVEVEILAEAYNECVPGGLEEATAAVNNALDNALRTGVDPVEWTTEDLKKFFPDVTEADAANIKSMLSATYSQLDALTIDVPVTANAVVSWNLPDDPVFGPSGTNFDPSTWHSGLITEMPELTVDVPVSPEFSSDYKFNNADVLEAAGIPDSITKTVTVNVVANPVYSGFNSTWWTSATPAKNARGGIVSGGPQQVIVGEEGSPEMIIPLGSQRRERGLKLWMKAGEMLGAIGGQRFARGGLTTGGPDEGIRFASYGNTERTGGNDVQVDVGGVNITIHVDAGSADNVAAAIRAQSGEIAETVAEILADELGAQFAATPLKGGIA